MATVDLSKCYKCEKEFDEGDYAWIQTYARIMTKGTGALFSEQRVAVCDDCK